MAASIASVFQSVRGPRDKLVRGVVTLDNPHGAGGDVLDLSGYFSTAVTGGRVVGDCAGYQVNYVLADLGDPATGKVHARFFDYDAAADGVAITAAGVDLSAVAVEMEFSGY